MPSLILTRWHQGNRTTRFPAAAPDLPGAFSRPAAARSVTLRRRLSRVCGRLSDRRLAGRSAARRSRRVRLLPCVRGDVSGWSHPLHDEPPAGGAHARSARRRWRRRRAASRGARSSNCAESSGVRCASVRSRRAAATVARRSLRLSATLCSICRASAFSSSRRRAMPTVS